MQHEMQLQKQNQHEHFTSPILQYSDISINLNASPLAYVAFPNIRSTTSVNRTIY